VLDSELRLKIRVSWFDSAPGRHFRPYFAQSSWGACQTKVGYAVAKICYTLVRADLQPALM
jgi:hypothetical protein